MTPRTRRLLADAEAMRTEFAGHPVVTVEPLGFDPPEQYRVTLRVASAQISPQTGQPAVVHEHRVLITLSASYPRDKPYCVAETAVFHPNFGPNAGEEICLGDFWTPAQSLVDIVAKIGEMLQFQAYNVRSPLNALAARWVADNEQVFPLGTTMLFQAEPEISFGEPAGDDNASGSAGGDGPVEVWFPPTSTAEDAGASPAGGVPVAPVPPADVPVAAVEPADSVPVAPVAAVEPADSVPVAPVAAVEPADSVPVAPVAPVEPADSVPGVPVAPVEPAEPSAPAPDAPSASVAHEAPQEPTEASQEAAPRPWYEQFGSSQ